MLSHLLKGKAMLAKSNQTKKEYQELLLENMNSMFNLAYRMTRNREDAADLVQEAALRGYRFFHRFERGTNFKGWILTVLRNLFINEYRRHKREPGKVSYDEVEGFIGAPDMKGFEEEIFGEMLQRAIDQLPEEMRTVLTLFYVDGFSYKEISKIMDCPIGTVMSRLHMAKRYLKSKLKALAKKGSVEG
jgi:RNA polymerase sigma-70 factor (ECF subfamily)